MSNIAYDTSLTNPKPDPKEKGKAAGWQWPDTTKQPDYSRDETCLPEALIAWGIAQCSDTKATGAGIGIDVLSVSGENLAWHPGATDEELERLMQLPQLVAEERVLQICFINTLNSFRGNLPGQFNFRSSTLQSLRKIGISSLLLSNMYTKSSNWAKMGNQKLKRHDQITNFPVFELCYQYRFGWNKPQSISYIHAKHDHATSTYFCINYPASAFLTLTNILRKSPNSAHREFIIDFLAAEQSLTRWQEDIDDRRHVLFIKERMYQFGMLDMDFGKETRELHQISKEWLALREDLVAFHAQLGYLLNAYNEFSHIKTTATGWRIVSVEDEYNPFEVLVSQAEICSRWTAVYRERTEICIQMLFHLSNQAIANSSREIAEQTQRDSASMITVAAVTLVFLPGTFISALLSTTVFDYGHEGVQVSQQWWILLATTIPLTIVVVIFWVWWRYVWLQNQDAKRRIGAHLKKKAE